MAVLECASDVLAFRRTAIVELEVTTPNLIALHGFLDLFLVHGDFLVDSCLLQALCMFCFL